MEIYPEDSKHLEKTDTRNIFDITRKNIINNFLGIRADVDKYPKERIHFEEENRTIHLKT